MNEKEKSPLPLRERKSTERSLSILPFGKKLQTFGEKIGLNKYKEEIEVRGQRRLSEEQRHRIQGPRWAHQATLESKRPQLAEKRRPSSY